MARYSPIFRPKNLYISRFPLNTVPCWQRVTENSSTIDGQFSAGVSQMSELWQIDPSLGSPGTPPKTILPQDGAGPGSGLGSLPYAVQALGYFVQSCIGYAVSGGAGKGIKRVLPAQHPDIPYLWASRIGSVEGMGPYGISGSSSAMWKLINVRVQYETAPYYILPDGIPEWQRFTVPDSEPDVEFVQKRTGAFQFPVNVALGPVSGQAIPDTYGAALKIQKTRKTFLWCQVPDNGLFLNGFNAGANSPNIEKCLGTVNSVQFMGFPPGTMLLEGCRYVSKTYPWMSNVGGIISSFPRAWDVKLVWSYFGCHVSPQPAGVVPPTTIADPAVYAINSTLGHQCVPHPTNGFWYRPFQQGGNDGPPFWRYPVADHNQVFLMNS